ncbi:hypothetical protein D3C76_1733430 [compost metagenome]
MNQADCRRKLFGMKRLEQITLRPQPQRFCCIMDLLEGCNDDHLDLRPFLLDLPGSLQAVHFRHMNIHQDNIREFSKT